MARLLATVLAALVFAPAALADGGPSPGLSLGWPGVSGGELHYVTHVGPGGTDVLALRGRGGSAAVRGHLAGPWGVPVVTWEGDAGGLSTDGRTLVLQRWTYGRPQTTILQPRTRFVVLDTRSLRLTQHLTLRGDFSFDALSPDARTLYLIEHDSFRNLTEYRVRAYDLAARRLLPQIIADRTSWETAMAGYPLSRITSRDGSWVYTLYQRSDGGKPFVHALDARHRTAVCLDLAWHGSQNDLWQTKLALDESRGTLALRDRDVSTDVALRVQLPSRARGGSQAGFPAKLAGGLGGGMAAALLFVGALRLHRRRGEPAPA